MNQETDQAAFSEEHPDAVFDTERRKRKAYKVLAAIKDFYGDEGKCGEYSLLDNGCAAGFMTSVYGTCFREVVGIDVDRQAVEYAEKNNSSDNVSFQIKDGADTGFPDDSFDVVTCTHIYEHVPDPYGLMDEIYRVLKPGGVCYFAAGNRLQLIEPHHSLPFLSIFPRWIGSLYLRVTGKGKTYREKHRTLWGLRKLVSKFNIVDYSKQIIMDPEKYHASYMLRPGSLKHKAAVMLVKYAYWMCPTYIWILEKKSSSER